MLPLAFHHPTFYLLLPHPLLLLSLLPLHPTLHLLSLLFPPLPITPFLSLSLPFLVSFSLSSPSPPLPPFPSPLVMSCTSDAMTSCRSRCCAFVLVSIRKRDKGDKREKIFYGDGSKGLALEYLWQLNSRNFCIKRFSSSPLCTRHVC